MPEKNSNELMYRKSGDFVTAKYKSSLLENQIMAIALSRLEVNNRAPGSPLEARLYPSELTKLVSDKVHIYRDLKKMSVALVGRSLVLEDGLGNFETISVVTNARYQDGEMVIRFNDVLRDHVLYSKKLEQIGYTKYELSIMTSFDKNAAFRLYELLKKEIYKIPVGSDEGVQVEYLLSELRFIIGVANIDEPSVKDSLKYMGKNIDWDELYAKLDKKERLHEEFKDFNRRVLKPAQAEVLEKSDIRFEYETVTKNRKVHKIIFTVYRNTPVVVEEINEKQEFLNHMEELDRQLEIPMDLHVELYRKFVGHNGLVKEDIDLLLKKASFDDATVEHYIEMADKEEHIGNYMGWIVKAIDAQFKEPIEVVEGSAEAAVEFKEIKEEYTKQKPALAVKFWEKAKTNEKFEKFIEFLAVNGLTLEQFELMYDVQERNNIFTDFMFDRVVEL